MTSLDLVMNVRSSSPEGGGAPENRAWQLRVLLRTCGTGQGIDFAPGAIPGLIQVQGAAASDRKTTAMVIAPQSICVRWSSLS